MQNNEPQLTVEDHARRLRIRAEMLERLLAVGAPAFVIKRQVRLLKQALARVEETWPGETDEEYAAHEAYAAANTYELSEAEEAELNELDALDDDDTDQFDDELRMRTDMFGPRDDNDH